MTFVVFVFSLCYPVVKRLTGIIYICMQFKNGNYKKTSFNVLKYSQIYNFYLPNALLLHLIYSKDISGATTIALKQR